MIRAGIDDEQISCIVSQFQAVCLLWICVQWFFFLIVWPRQTFRRIPARPVVPTVAFGQYHSVAPVSGQLVETVPQLEE